MNYVRQVIDLASKRQHTLAEIAQAVGIPEAEVEDILQDPSGAVRAYDAALRDKREALYKIRTARPPQAKPPQAPFGHRRCAHPCAWRLDGSSYCVAPVCWREVLRR